MKKRLKDSCYPMYTKVWFFIYIIINFLFGISFLYTKVLNIPYIALALINLYAIALLMKENRQGFYTLISSEIIFIAYTLITKKPTFFLTVGIINFLLILITWICCRRLWTKND